MQVVKHQGTKRTYHPMKDSQLREFGVWIQDEDWSNVLSAENTQQKADALYESLRGAIDRFFPMQIVKVQNKNKPWMSQNVKALLKRDRLPLSQVKTRCTISYVIRSREKLRRPKLTSMLSEFAFSSKQIQESGISKLNQ